MTSGEITKWLLQGDVAIQYQVHRDLLDTERQDLQSRIEKEGWGAAFLSKRRADGHWGQRFYQPKWTSSHYTLWDLRNLCISPKCKPARDSINMIVDEVKGSDGGINPHTELALSDVCINGHFLNYAAYFGIDEPKLHSVVDFVLSQIMPDGGFNCCSNRSGARHSSLHTTISILEGLEEYRINGYSYKLRELEEAKQSSIEFILIHQLFKSDRTGEIIHKDFLRLPYPSRWKYDILRALDYFQYAKIPWDDRMTPAIEVIKSKRRKDGTWPVQSKHPGAQHFEMEKAGKPSRWNTLRALRVFKRYGIEEPV